MTDDEYNKLQELYEELNEGVLRDDPVQNGECCESDYEEVKDAD